MTVCRFSPDDSMIGVGMDVAKQGVDNSLWNIETSSKLMEFSGITDYTSDLCFHPYEPIVCYISWDKTARLYDPISGNLMHEIPNVSPNYVSIL